MTHVQILKKRIFFTFTWFSFS